MTKAFQKIAVAFAIGVGLNAVHTCIASAEPGCSATVYFDANYGGPSRTLHGNVEFVGNFWNDQISAIVVHRGFWVFYWDAGYRGAELSLAPGEYPYIGNRWNDQISSARCVAPN